MLELSKAFTQEMEEKLQALGSLLSRELLSDQKLFREDRASVQKLVDNWRKIYDLTGLEIVTSAGALVVESYDPKESNLPKKPLPSLSTAGQASKELVHRQKVPGGMLISLVVPLPGPTGGVSAYLVLKDLTPKVLITKEAGADLKIQDLKAMQMLMGKITKTSRIIRG